MLLDISIFQKTAGLIGEGKETKVTSLSGSSTALLFSATTFPCLLLCASEKIAAEIHSDTIFFSKLMNKMPPVLISPDDNPDRLKGLVKLYENRSGRIIASVDAALSSFWSEREFPLVMITKGTTVDRERFVRRFLSLGYSTVKIVSGPGEMSQRGGIFDIFPLNHDQPVRIEFFGDEIESLRLFEIGTQLSIREINDIAVSPAIGPEDGPNLFEILRDSRIILNEPDDIARHYPDIIPVIEKSQEGDEEVGRPRISYFTGLPVKGEGVDPGISGLSGYGLIREEGRGIEQFVTRVDDLKSEHSILMVCSSEGQAKRLKDLFIDQDSDAPLIKEGTVLNYTGRIAITIGQLEAGFRFNSFIVLSEKDIFGRRPAFKSIRKSKVSKLIHSIEDFKVGDYLVHIDHGIGKYMGISKERAEDYEGDFMIVEYLDGDRLFVPLDRINHIQKYNSPGEVKPKIDKLGGRTWQKTRQKVKKKIRDMAEGLLKIYAKRSEAEGYGFSADTELHREFDNFFRYEETPDQLTSIKDIKKDMEMPVPMDRLLCGDVGYGKTEVVMRACFKSAFDSKQVAVLVPTTILAEQHYETFSTRFSAFPVKIDFLSRFKSRAEQKQTLKALEEGALDIVIGTHRLLAKDVCFFDLGLLVIDEEHKFGVAHKEKFKSLSERVDVLTLSATPIPRTLHMALSGIRGMSTIETPPEERMAVNSTVMRFNPKVIGEALQHEIDRGGQAFFVHNRIRDIYEIADMIRRTVPEGRIGVAHGQMKEKELELLMAKFFHQEINILVSTSIISSGLDVPSANTIIINRADRFGLADLYQLRGRVGRSNIRAYAYFLIPGEDLLTEESRKKLQAIQELGYLGAGFRLALKDLEIRGAGNLLGAEQSGHIQAVGFDMYMEMLESAVSELKGEKKAPEVEPVIELKVSALIPEEYIEDPDLRLSVYRKIVSLKESSAVKGIIDELRDRFGDLPEKAKRLIEIMELKAEARVLCITNIRNRAGMIELLFDQETPVSHEKILALYEGREKYLSFLPEGGIALDLRGRKWDEIRRSLKEIMKELAS